MLTVEEKLVNRARMYAGMCRAEDVVLRGKLPGDPEYDLLPDDIKGLIASQPAAGISQLRANVGQTVLDLARDNF